MASLLADSPARPLGPRAVAAPDLAPIFAMDPDLLAGVEPAAADLLRHRLRARRCWLEPGPWVPDREQLGAGEPSLGLLVLDGLMLRTVTLDRRKCPELIGAGDVLRPWDEHDDPAAVTSSGWVVLVPTTLAVLDAQVTAVTCRFPVVVRNLLARTVQRTRLLAVQMAIAHVRHAETRLLLLLWHLAERWGRVTPQGVHLPLPLKHEVLAHLACMRRPTASSALARLQRVGELERCEDATWLLLGDPPELEPAPC